MEKLDEGDFRRILGAIEVLGRDGAQATLPERIVEAIASAINVDFISYNEVDTGTGATRFHLKPDPADLDPGSFAYAAFIRRFGNHPMVAQRAAASGRDDPGLARFVNRLRLLGMVGNCCGEAELRLNLGMTVPSAGPKRVGIAIHRSVRDFDDRDAAVLDALKPHILAACRNALDRGEQPAAALAHHALTPRESEVLYWVSMGKTNSEVGEIIGAKPMTVKKHLERIYDKLGVPNRTAAARMATQTGSGSRAKLPP